MIETIIQSGGNWLLKVERVSYSSRGERKAAYVGIFGTKDKVSEETHASSAPVFLSFDDALELADAIHAAALMMEIKS